MRERMRKSERERERERIRKNEREREKYKKQFFGHSTPGHIVEKWIMPKEGQNLPTGFNTFFSFSILSVENKR